MIVGIALQKLSGLKVHFVNNSATVFLHLKYCTYVQIPYVSMKSTVK